MSGYLSRLVDRAVGAPAAGVQPRLAPVFPLGPAPRRQAPPADEFPLEAAAAPVPQPRPSPRREHTALPSRPGRSRSSARRPVPPQPETAPPAATRREETPTASPGREQGLERRVPVDAAAAPAREPDHPDSPRVGEPRAPTIVVAMPRVALDRAPDTRRPAPLEPRAPRIDVRIGRVEVRPSPPPEPVQWAPAPAEERTATGFGDLAAARRYLDRRWS